MSKATVKAHQRGLKNTLLWENCIPVTVEDCYGYGHYLEDLCQEKEAAIWYEKATELGHIPASFQLARLMKSGWVQGDLQRLISRVMDHDLHSSNVISYYRLGKCFTNGWGTQQDENAGLYWLKKALDDCEESVDVYSQLLFELSFYHEKGLAGTEIDTTLACNYLTMAHEKGCQKAIWELWRLFPGNFSEFPLRRDYTEAWSFRLGRYLRAVEEAPCIDYFLRLSSFYEQGFPDDSEENRLKMKRFAKEYAYQASCSSKGACYDG